MGSFIKYMNIKRKHDEHTFSKHEAKHINSFISQYKGFSKQEVDKFIEKAKKNSNQFEEFGTFCYIKNSGCPPLPWT